MTKLTAAWIAALVAAAGLVACGADDDPNRGLPQGSEPVTLKPADFTTSIDNPYFPMSVGTRWEYRETDTAGGREKVVVRVTDKTKKIANGVTARVIRDTVTARGVPVEVTDDWYAQDKDGNVWYLGEYVTNYEDGKVADHAGSFEAGVDGAQAGIAMPAKPKPGLSYRQEYLKGEAEDRGAIVTVGEEQVEVPFGFYEQDVVMTRDLVPTEPRAQELKFYVRGIGPVLSVHTDGDGGRAELVAFKRGRQRPPPPDRLQRGDLRRRALLGEHPQRERPGRVRAPAQHGDAHLLVHVVGLGQRRAVDRRRDKRGGERRERRSAALKRSPTR